MLNLTSQGISEYYLLRMSLWKMKYCSLLVILRFTNFKLSISSLKNDLFFFSFFLFLIKMKESIYEEIIHMP